MEQREQRSPEASQEAVEARVRKVQHLDPFTIVCHADGRFTAALETPPSEVDPEMARSIVDKVDEALEPLREIAAGPE